MSNKLDIRLFTCYYFLFAATTTFIDTSSNASFTDTQPNIPIAKTEMYNTTMTTDQKYIQNYSTLSRFETYSTEIILGQTDSFPSSVAVLVSVIITLIIIIIIGCLMTVLCMWHMNKLSRIDLSKHEEVESGNTTSQQFTKLTSLDHNISNNDDYERTIVQGPRMASYSNSCYTIIDTETKENNPLTSSFKATSSHYEYDEISIKETENNITQDSNKSTQLVRQDSDQRISNKNDFSVKDLAPSERNTHDYDKQRQLYSSVKNIHPNFQCLKSLHQTY